MNFNEIKNSVKVNSQIVDEQGAVCTIVEFDNDLEMLTVKYGDGMEMPLLPVQFKGLAKGKPETMPEPKPEPKTASDKSKVNAPKAETKVESKEGRKQWFGPTPPQIMLIMGTLLKRRPVEDPERTWDSISFGFLRSIRSVGDGIRVLDLLLASDETFSNDGAELPVSTKQSRWAFMMLTKDEKMPADDANTVIASMTRKGFQDLLDRHGKQFSEAA